MIPLPHKVKQKISSPLQLHQSHPTSHLNKYRLSLQNTNIHSNQHPSYIQTNTPKQLDFGGEVVNKKSHDFGRIERDTQDITIKQARQSEPTRQYYLPKNQRSKQPKINNNKNQPQSPLLKIMQSSSQYAFQDVNKNGHKQSKEAEYLRVLEQKQQQIRILTLELQRYRRCEQINKQNQQIYRKLVAMLGQQKFQIKAQAEMYESRMIQNQTKTTKVKEINVPDTTRFMYPQTIRNQNGDDRKKANNFGTPLRISQEIQSKYCSDQHYIEGSANRNKNQTAQYLPLKNKHTDEDDSKTMTFNFNKEDKQQKRQQYMRNGTNSNHKYPFYLIKPPNVSAKFVEMPIEHKLSAINKSLWNKRQEQMHQRRLQRSNLCSTQLLLEYSGNNKGKRVSSISDKSLFKLHF